MDPNDFISSISDDLNEWTSSDSSRASIKSNIERYKNRHNYDHPTEPVAKSYKFVSLASRLKMNSAVVEILFEEIINIENESEINKLKELLFLIKLSSIQANQKINEAKKKNNDTIRREMEGRAYALEQVKAYEEALARVEITSDEKYKRIIETWDIFIEEFISRFEACGNQISKLSNSDFKVYRILERVSPKMRRAIDEKENEMVDVSDWDYYRKIHPHQIRSVVILMSKEFR